MAVLATSIVKNELHNEELYLISFNFTTIS